MRSLHEAGGAVEVYSPAEELFNRRRRTVGLIGGPVALLALLAAPIPIAAPAHRLVDESLYCDRDRLDIAGFVLSVLVVSSLGWVI